MMMHMHICRCARRIEQQQRAHRTTVPKTLGSPLTRLPTRSRHEMPAMHGGATSSPNFAGSTTGASTTLSTSTDDASWLSCSTTLGTGAATCGCAAARAAHAARRARRVHFSACEQSCNRRGCCSTHDGSDALHDGACSGVDAGANTSPDETTTTAST